MTPAQAAAARRAGAFEGPGRSAPQAPRQARPQAPLRVVERPVRRPSRTARRLTAAVSVLVVLGSLVAVVVARAVIDQGQIRLTTLQSQISGAEAAHASAELKLAELQAPSAVVGAAQRAHLATPTPATQVPSVPLSRPLGAPKVTATTVPGQVGAAQTPSTTAGTTATTPTSSTAPASVATTSPSAGPGTSAADAPAGASGSPSTSTLPAVTGTAASP